MGAIHGTGLGLSLAERAALACGGELRLVSSSGEGTLFRCVLPAGR
ncbi:MAG: ATP-binding protein [Burkholderiaceae bacterium]